MPTDNLCPECGKGQLEVVVSSRSFDVEGRVVVVPGLMPFQCAGCGAKVWPNSEAERARKVLDILKRPQAA